MNTTVLFLTKLSSNPLCQGALLAWVLAGKGVMSAAPL